MPALSWDRDQQSQGWTKGSVLQLGEKVSLFRILPIVPTGPVWFRFLLFSFFKDLSFLLPPVTAAGVAALILGVLDIGAGVAYRGSVLCVNKH